MIRIESPANPGAAASDRATEPPQEATKKPSRGWFYRCFHATCASIIALIVLGFICLIGVFFILSRGPMDLPFVKSRIETQLNALPTEVGFKLGGVFISNSPDSKSSIVGLRDIHISDENGLDLVVIPRAETNFSIFDAIAGKMRPRQIGIEEAEISIIRDLNGKLNIAASMGADPEAEPRELYKVFDEFWQAPTFAKLSSIRLTQTAITFVDMLADRTWNIDDGLVEVSRTGEEIEIRAELALRKVGKSPTTALLTAQRQVGDPLSSFSIKFENAEPEAVADEIAAFDWLRLLQAPVSGSIQMQMSGMGEVTTLAGALEIGQGRLTPSLASKSKAIGFDGAKAYFSFDAAADRFSFSEVSVQSAVGMAIAEGHAYLQRKSRRKLEAMVGQFQISELTINQRELFSETLRFDQGELDLKISFDPLVVNIGQLNLNTGDTRITAFGKTIAHEDFWQNSYEVKADAFSRDRLLSMWPGTTIPKTRNWVAQNIPHAQVTNLHAAVRTHEGIPTFALTFNAQDVTARYMPSLPVINEGVGFGYLTERDFRIDLTAGHVIAPDQTKIDLAGSSFFVPDINAALRVSEIKLQAAGGLGAALHMLDLKPFEYLAKAGLSPRIAAGHSQVQAEFTVPLARNISTKDVRFSAKADLTGVTSKTLVSGHNLTAKALRLNVSNAGLSLDGNVNIGKIATRANWSMPFGTSGRDSNQVVLDLAVSNASLAEFNITLPKGSLKGSAPARATVTLRRGQNPEYALTSSLVGLGLSIPALNWSKSAAAKGQFTLSGNLGDRPTIDRISLNAKGLEARGSISLTPSGNMARANFSRLKVGSWLNSSAAIINTGGNNSRVELRGGMADLRHVSFASSRGSTSGLPIDFRLDRLNVTDGITLRNFRGNLASSNGVRGRFTANVNGKTPIQGSLFPKEHGSAVEIFAQDGGAVMRAAGLFGGAYGGEMKLSLVPRQESGNYNGALVIKNTRVRRASAMADLLNALSVIGLLQQLNGAGIHFATVDGKFRLRPQGVELQQASAVGPSMGITLDGWYDSRKNSVDFQGVVTPIYVVNGALERIFRKLVGRQKGEGLFGFTYRMKGTSRDPRVSVNPLSILTPGRFREIFRKPMPVPQT